MRADRHGLDVAVEVDGPGAREGVVHAVVLRVDDVREGVGHARLPVGRVVDAAFEGELGHVAGARHYHVDGRARGPYRPAEVVVTVQGADALAADGQDRGPDRRREGSVCFRVAADAGLLDRLVHGQRVAVVVDAVVRHLEGAWVDGGVGVGAVEVVLAAVAVRVDDRGGSVHAVAVLVDAVGEDLGGVGVDGVEVVVTVEDVAALVEQGHAVAVDVGDVLRVAVLVDAVVRDLDRSRVDGRVGVVAVVGQGVAVQVVVHDPVAGRVVRGVAVLVDAVVQDLGIARAHARVEVVAVVAGEVVAGVTVHVLIEVVVGVAVLVDTVVPDLVGQGIDGRVGVVTIDDFTVAVHVHEPVSVRVDASARAGGAGLGRHGAVELVAVLVDAVTGVVRCVGVHGCIVVVAVVATGGFVVEAVAVHVVVDGGGDGGGRRRSDGRHGAAGDRADVLGRGVAAVLAAGEGDNEGQGQGRGTHVTFLLTSHIPVAIQF